MARPITMLAAALLLGTSVGATGVAYAQQAATLNSCWGQITQEFAALGAGTIGEHSSALSDFTPTPTGLGGEEEPPFDRRGVANQSRFLEEIEVIENGEPSEGGNGAHALANASGVPELADIECDGPPVP